MCVHLFNVIFYKKLCVVIILLLKTENQSRQLVLLEIYTLWSTMVLTLICKMKYHFPFFLKGNFPQTTMWIRWVESNFTNPTVKVWANLDNPFKGSNCAKFCMSSCLDGTLPESVIPQENKSLLTLYIDFLSFFFFFFFFFFLGYQ